MHRSVQVELLQRIHLLQIIRNVNLFLNQQLVNIIGQTIHKAYHKYSFVNGYQYVSINGILKNGEIGHILLFGISMVKMVNLVQMVQYLCYLSYSVEQILFLENQIQQTVVTVNQYLKEK